MKRVTVVSTKGMMERIISELHSKKVIDIIEHRDFETADIGSPLSSGAEISELLVKARSLMTLLKIEPKKLKHVIVEDDMSQIRKRVGLLHKEVNKKMDEIKQLEEARRKDMEVLRELQVADKLELPLEAFSGIRSLCRFVGYVRDAKRLSEKIEEISDDFEIYSDDKGAIAAVFARSEDAEKIREVLAQEGFSEISLNLDGMEGKLASKIREIEKRLRETEKKAQSVRRAIEDIRRKNEDYIVKVENVLSIGSEKADAPLRFASTERTFMVTGWVLEKRAKNLAESLEKLTKERVFIKIEEPQKGDKVPAKLSNPKVARPFEALMDLYALPLYREIDPTFFMFLTFPLLFGFMLGDWGYGLVTLFLFLVLKKLIPAGRKFFNILMLSSMATIFFGLLFGEFFGAEVLFGWDMPRILSRTHQLETLLVIAIGVGVIHVNFGIINGFVNEFRNHGLRAAVLEKASWLFFEGGIAMLALSYTGIWALKPLVGWVVTVAAVAMIYGGEGVQGLVELPGIFSNILSYARLMAIGIASVKLAEVVNEFAGQFFRQGGMGIIWAVLLLVVGHIINIALGIIGPFLHSLRLHYVEFFNRFYKGGARRFRVFGARAQ